MRKRADGDHREIDGAAAAGVSQLERAEQAGAGDSVADDRLQVREERAERGIDIRIGARRPARGEGVECEEASADRYEASRCATRDLNSPLTA